MKTQTEIVIKTETEYKKAVKELERIGDKSDFGDNPADVIKFESLSDTIKQYENKNHQLDVGDPIEIIKLKMEYMGLTRAEEDMADKKYTEEDIINIVKKSRETGLTAEYLILQLNKQNNE